jgi:poly-gamma-glutamate synthesis protein (capsule biosynthesis protein)
MNRGEETEMDEKERNRRRKAAKRARQRQLRRRIAIFAIACVALLAVILIAVNVGSRDKTSVSSGEISVNTGSAVSASAASESVSADSSVMAGSSSEDIGTDSDSAVNAEVTISAAGDCTLGTDEYFDQTTSFPAVYNSVNDPSYFFSNVKDVFAADDLTIVNMEGTLTTETTRADKTYAFKGDPSYAEILVEGSVEAANLANNHSHDYGEKSYQDTIDALTEAGITPFGYDNSAVVTINGVKVGLVGIYELDDGIDCKDELLEQIESVKEQGAQLIITSFHWGTERVYYPDSVQVELAHTAIDNGAALVLGHHPHVLEGIETYHGRKIVYSLGNFCFGGNSNPSDKDTMIYQQTFHIENGEVAYDDDSTIIPCSISSVSSSNNYQPTVLTGTEAERVLAEIDQYSEGLSTDPDQPS